MDDEQGEVGLPVSGKRNEGKGPLVIEGAGFFRGEEKRFGGEGQMGWTGLGWALAGLVGLTPFFVLFLFFHFCFFNSVLNSFNYFKHSFVFKSLSKFVWI